MAGQGVRMELAHFFKQMAVLVRAGVPLERALSICRPTAHHSGMARAIDGLADELRHGVSLADAVGSQGFPFTAVHAHALRVNQSGEGDFSAAFDCLSRWEEKDYRLQARVRSLLAYPLFLAILSLCGTLLLIHFLVPLMASVAQALKRPLPLPTRILMEFGQVLDDPLSLGLLGIFSATFVLIGRGLVRGRRFQLFWARRCYTIPLYGGLARKAMLIRVSRLFGSLLQAGLPLTQALDLAAHALGNPVLADVLSETSRRVMLGETLSQALQGWSAFPSGYVGMITVGESTGRLAELLSRLGDLYEMELDNDIEAVMRAAEPILIALVGLVVLLLLGCAFLPMYDVMGAGSV